MKLTCNEARSTQCWFNCANVWVPSRVSAAPAAAEPSASDRRLGEELPVVPLSDTGDRSKETVQQSSDSRDISEGTKQNYTGTELMYLILQLKSLISGQKD